MTEPMKREGVVYGLPEGEYHGGKGELSSTGAKLILDSPAKFKHTVLDSNRVEKKAWNIGTAVHTKVLGVGADAVACPPDLLASNGAMTTKAAKEWKAEREAAGLIVVKASELAEVNAMAEAVLAHPTAKLLFERPGHSEVSVFDEVDGARRRGRFDYLPDEGGIAVDLKTVQDGSTGGFARAAANFGYHIQRGHYLDILERATGRELDMLFVVVEKAAPHLVAVHKLNDQFADMGTGEALQALDIYRRCMRLNEWPGYPDEVTDVMPPVYAIYDYQDKYENGEITL